MLELLEYNDRRHDWSSSYLHSPANESVPGSPSYSETSDYTPYGREAPISPSEQEAPFEGEEEQLLVMFHDAAHPSVPDFWPRDSNENLCWQDPPHTSPHVPEMSGEPHFGLATYSAEPHYEHLQQPELHLATHAELLSPAAMQQGSVDVTEDVLVLENEGDGEKSFSAPSSPSPQVSIGEQDVPHSILDAPPHDISALRLLAVHLIAYDRDVGAYDLAFGVELPQCLPDGSPIDSTTEFVLASLPVHVVPASAALKQKQIGSKLKSDFKFIHSRTEWTNPLKMTRTFTFPNVVPDASSYGPPSIYESPQNASSNSNAPITCFPARYSRNENEGSFIHFRFALIALMPVISSKHNPKGPVPVFIAVSDIQPWTKNPTDAQCKLACFSAIQSCESGWTEKQTSAEMESILDALKGDKCEAAHKRFSNPCPMFPTRQDRLDTLHAAVTMKEEAIRKGLHISFPRDVFLSLWDHTRNFVANMLEQEALRRRNGTDGQYSLSKEILPLNSKRRPLAKQVLENVLQFSSHGDSSPRSKRKD